MSFICFKVVLVKVRKEKSDLFERVLITVGPVGSVPGISETKHAPDGVRGFVASTDHLGGTHQTAPVGYSVFLGQNVSVTRAGTHVGHQSVIESIQNCVLFCLVLFCFVFVLFLMEHKSRPFRH